MPTNEIKADEAAPGASSNEPKPRGFAAMTPETHKSVASKGGRAAHSLGVAHKFSKEEASAAGRLGGRKTASIPGHMASMGRKGAQVRREALPRSTVPSINSITM